MRLEAKIKQVIADDGELTITIRGWSEADPAGTMERPLGNIHVPSNARNRRAYYIGRRVFIDVKPA